VGSRSIDPGSLRAFAERDWQRVARHKATYWAERRAQVGVAAAFVAAEALRAHMRALDPSWPDAAQRADDLAHHVACARLLARARPG
jgi:hypothetical protein